MSTVFFRVRSATWVLCLAAHLGVGEGYAATAFLKIVANQPGVEAPVPVRAIIQKPDGSFVPGEWGDSVWPVVTIHGKAVSKDTLVELPLGTSRVTIGKGPEFYPQTLTANLSQAGSTNVMEVQMQPVLDLYGQGWRAGDAHVHFFHGDNQVARTPEEAYTICGAGGLNWVSLAGEHYGAGLLSRDQALGTWEQHEREDCQLWLGSEAPKSAWGHFASVVTDPWSVSETLPYSDGIREVHAQGGISFPVHPDRLFPFRTSEFGYYFYPFNNHQKFLPFSVLAGHLLDGWSAISDQPSGPDLLKTYHKLLSMGYKIPLLADSDYCMDRVNNGLKAPGFWMNYVQIGDHPLSRAAVSEGIRRGRVMATTGPLVLFNIDGQLPGASLPANGSARQFRIEASYAFNPWTLSSSNFTGTAKCAIQSVELLRNGEVVRQWNPNQPHFTIEETLPPETEKCNYMVRVVGNEGVWMAGYSSPIYFETQAAPRRPSVFKSLIKGRLYDAKTGSPVTGTVSAMRFGMTEWTIATDANGLFRARVPIDATLVARDSQGRELKRDWMSYEPAYAFGHYLPERYQDKTDAIDDFTDLMREMNWEFPMGRQSASSYVKAQLNQNAVISDVAVIYAPPRHPGKQNTEIVMLLVDKTQVQNGDTLNYTVIFRSPEGVAPQETLMVQVGGWDPNFPRLYTRYGKLIAETRPWEALTSLGNGFYMRQGSAVVPSWARNINGTSGGVRLRVSVRQTADVIEDAHLTLRIGPTRRELLVSTSWDGFPATWGGRGVGPCNFSREIGWQARYSDNRHATVQFRLNGSLATVNPKADTGAVADADDAIFENHHYYDAQCEPEYRNIPFRDPVRPQPPESNCAIIPIANPADTTPPSVAAIEPSQDQLVSSPVRLYYYVDDAGLSGAAEATLFLNGEPVALTSPEPPTVLHLAPGEYTWQVRGEDRAGNAALSVEKRFRVLTETGEEPPGSEDRNSARFIGEDRSGGGSWKGRFGAEGYHIIGDVESIPSYVSVNASGKSQWLWNANTTSPAATQRAFDSTRLAACYYATTPYDLRFKFQDTLEHRVTFYFLDWDLMQREQRVELLDAVSGRKLGEQIVTGFGNGVYHSWLLKGDVIARVHPVHGNAVVSAIFFDANAPRTSIASPTFAPGAGTFAEPVQVKITPEASGDTIYYTVDGSTPTVSSSLYTAPINIDKSLTLKAIAYAPELGASSVASANYTIQQKTPPGSARVEFAGADLVTGGTWKGRYGAEGKAILQDQHSIPAGIQIQPTQKSDWVWKISVDDPRALQRLNSDSRLAACWYSSTAFEVDLNLTDGAAHIVSLYCLDWDRGGRSQRVQLLDYTTRQLLDEVILQGFGDGVYLKYRITGRVIARFIRDVGSNAVLSGIFIDPDGEIAAAPTISPPGGTFEQEVIVGLSSTTANARIYFTTNGSTPGEASTRYVTPIKLTNTTTLKAIAIADGFAPSVISTAEFNVTPPNSGPSANVVFQGLDVSTRGNWKGKYGSAGHITVNDSQVLPDSLTIGTLQKLEWTWSGATTDERVLERATTTARVAACWYHPDYFEVELKFQDQNTHKVSVYALDWDRAARVQRVEVLDFTTRQVLHSYDLADFGEGVYLSYNITSPVILRLKKVNSHNSVLSGIFFD